MDCAICWLYTGRVVPLFLKVVCLHTQFRYILFCNRDEAIGFTQTDSIENAVEALKQYTKQFAITCGADGALIYDGKQLIQVAANPVKAVDTNGAGDMFAGAFLYALTQGHDHTKAGEFASLAASKVVSQFGPRLKAEQHSELKTTYLF